MCGLEAGQIGLHPSNKVMRAEPDRGRSDLAGAPEPMDDCGTRMQHTSA